MKPRKHAEVIKAWADGAEVEVWVINVGWKEIDQPMWSEDSDYRVKPKAEAEPEKRWLYIYNDSEQGRSFLSPFSPKQQGLNVLLKFEYMGKIEVSK